MGVERFFTPLRCVQNEGTAVLKRIVMIMVEIGGIECWCML